MRKANPGAFVKGDPRAGRPRGVPNKVTIEVREWARSILEDKAVQARTLAQARAGKLPPAIFNELLHYAYGKPKDTVELLGAVALTTVARVIVDARDDAGD